MEAWQEEQLHALLSIDSEEKLFAQMASLAAAIGFEYCAYGIRLPIPVSRPNVVMFNNYSQQWRERYEACNYLHSDPTVQHAFKSTLPVVWTNALFAPSPELWEEARSHGLRHGWAQPSRDARGGVGLLTLARSDGRLSEGELRENQAKMSWLAQYAHAAMAQLLIPGRVPGSEAVLTAREREVMLWAADGKTANEVAQILSLSERTVNFHITNILSKLNASTKTQAIVKAVALGMLY